MSTACKDISELTPNAQEACNAFLKLCEQRGLKVRITETYRSQKRQNELYAQGRTAPGKVVTWTKNSRHTSRRAWDICQNIKGREYDTSGGFFKKCGEAAAALNITWGGTWKRADMPHFEISRNWAKPKTYLQEEIDMEELKRLQEQVQRLANTVEALTAKADALAAQLPTVYHYTQDVPDWGRPTVQKLLDKGIFAGAAPDDLNLPEEMLRIFVTNDRSGLYD